MAGRPAVYTEPEILEKSVQEYFAQDGPKTVSGLAFHLGFESRQSLYDYEQKGEFSYIIKRAKLKVEIEYEKQLSQNCGAGPIFALKNMGWKDKTETALTGTDGGPVVITGMTIT